MTRLVGVALTVIGAALVLFALTLPDALSAMALAWLIGLPLMLFGSDLWADPR